MREASNDNSRKSNSASPKSSIAYPDAGNFLTARSKCPCERDVSLLPQQHGFGDSPQFNRRPEAATAPESITEAEHYRSYTCWEFVTISAARSQSSLSASGRSASVTKATVGHWHNASGLVAGDPPWRAKHRWGIRSSASAASHSFSRKASLAVRIRCRRPSLPRTPTL